MRRTIATICLLAWLTAGCTGKHQGTGKATGGSGSSGGATSGSAATGSTSGTTEAEARKRARAFVDHLSGGTFDAAAKMMTKRMLEVMPASKLAGTWKQLGAQLGGFKRVLGIEGKRIKGSHTFRLTAQFGLRPFAIVVSIDSAGKVQGLFFRPAKLERPQHPRPPFPYVSRDVEITNKADKVKLAGTLTHPKGPGPFAAAVLVSGSGAQDRDETILQHKPFLVLADHLTRAGFAVLRYDDRGVGKSGGDASKVTMPSNARDAAAAVDFLRAQKNINAKAIGIIGHSEGGALAPMIAARRGDIAFIVSLAGSALPGDKIVTQQVMTMARAVPGMSKDKLDKLRAAQISVLAAAKGGDKQKLLAVLKKVNILGKSLGMPGGEVTPALLAQQAAQLLSPWYQSFLTIDPATHWSKVNKTRVLALDGTKDTQVVAAQNLPAIAAALKKARNPDVTTKALAGLNHLFQRCKTGQVSEYATISATFDKGALELISKWLTKRFAPAKRGH